MPREMIILPYDSGWGKLFDDIKKQLHAIFGDTATEIVHFGSTSIKGMPSKPIIDVMVIVNDINAVDKLNDRMTAAGYVARGENGIAGRRYFQMFAPDGKNHTQHIHCYEKDNENAKNNLMFRDYLLADADAFEAYKRIKLEASERYRYSPIEYTEYKAFGVTRIMEKARKYFETEEK